MTSLKRNDRNKRKRNDVLLTEDCKVERYRVETILVAGIDESSSELISFLEFRRSTIDLYPSLNWLGPGVMAVYWFKEYLKKTPFNWIQRPKENHPSLPSSLPSSRDGERRSSDKEKRRRRQVRPKKRKGNFYFIPGQYLRGDGDENGTIATAKDVAIQNVLDFGIPGIHYATSYIGVYNLLRSYGSYATRAEHNPPRKRQSSRLHNAALSNQKGFLVDYIGPPLPK